MNKENPIGVLDSGVGGISVLKALVENLPGEHFIYFGDSANAPYGNRSRAEILDLTMKAVERLMERECKAIVVACNTATAAAIKELREKYRETVIIGLEPAVKPAVLSNPGGKIAVLATPFTLASEKYLSLVEPYEKRADIVSIPAQEIVRFVERREYYSKELVEYLKTLFAPYRDDPFQAIVLGCTHFPFAKRAIREAAGEMVQFYDSAMGVERQVVRLLEMKGILNEKESGGWVEIDNSAGAEAVELCRDLLKASY